MIARDNLINVHLPEDGFGDYPHTAVAQGGAEPAGRCVRAFLRGILFSINEMTAGAKGQGHDGEGGAGNSTAGEGAGVGDDEVRRVPNLL
jgi:hypothetical protein